jgi:hypothetical protein
VTRRERWDEWLDNLQDRFGQKRIIMLGVLFITGLASLVIQQLIRYDLDNTAALYLAVPYCVAVLITLLRPYGQNDKWWQRFISHSVTALVVFLASSAVLFEGFLCVLFFMPIYFFGVTLAFIASWIGVTMDARKSKTYATAIPLLVAFFSLEGTSEVTTFDRHNLATATATVSLAPQELLQNLATPFELPSSDDWMLGLFPMPHAIEAGSLDVGDIHRVHTRYHRWFITNTHEGVIEIRIDSVTPERVTVSFVRDTSFFSSYVRLIGSDIRFVTDANGLTEVSLTVSYERRLDPAWYFQPMQQYAMQAMASHLIDEVIVRD